MSDIRPMGKKTVSYKLSLLFQVKVPGSIPDRTLGNFQVTYSVCAHSLLLGSTQPVTEMRTKKYPGGKVRPARTAESSAVLICDESQINL
jgi:hypothetical protein